jgi:hypothetical protein
MAWANIFPGLFLARLAATSIAHISNMPGTRGNRNQRCSIPCARRCTSPAGSGRNIKCQSQKSKRTRRSSHTITDCIVLKPPGLVRKSQVIKDHRNALRLATRMLRCRRPQPLSSGCFMNEIPTAQKQECVVFIPSWWYATMARYLSSVFLHRGLMDSWDMGLGSNI